jgi:hypothetical protein
MAKRQSAAERQATKAEDSHRAIVEAMINLDTPRYDMLRRLFGQKPVDLVYGNDRAWLETPELVATIETPGFPISVWPKEEAYTAFGIKPQALQRFTRGDVRQKFFETKSYGPWK